jgi:FkbM family methyltransferase
MDNLFQKVAFRVKRLTTPAEYKGQVSFSQCGEDIIVNYLFGLRGISHPTYLDIGANDPLFISNTAFFYKKGCRGINIEANPALIHKFEKFRKEDINLNIGISHKEDTLDFYVMEDNTLSTFSAEEKERLVQAGHKVKEVKPVQLMTIAQVLEKYNNNIFPDFLSIDVEGMDFEILQSLDFSKSAPKVICVEAAEYSPTGSGARKQELIDFLTGKGYYEYANTNLNAIMVQKKFWFV